MIKRIYLIRHGETDWNLQERFQGHTDIPLNSTGKEQAQRLIRPLQSLGIQAVLTSDLSRAKETGKVLADAYSIPTHIRPGIKEANLGLCEGRKHEDISQFVGRETLAKWRSHYYIDFQASYPNGETGEQIVHRTVRTLEEFLENYPYSTIAVASHGGVIRRFLQSIIGEGGESIPIPNTIVYGLDYIKNPNHNHQGLFISRKWRLRNHIEFRR
jgi:probable phosphoglycerate mutase